MQDPAEGVRNNAMRALAVLARFALRSPQSQLRIPPRPFVDLLRVAFSLARRASQAPNHSHNLVATAVTKREDNRHPLIVARQIDDFL